MEEIAKRNPVNKLAAIVTSRGISFRSKKKDLANESDTPFTLVRMPLEQPEFKSLVGVRRGRLVVCGFIGRSRWSCRCDCGKYCTRHTRAMKNESNDVDRCEQCRELAYLKRVDEFRRNGRNASEKWE